MLIEDDLDLEDDAPAASWASIRDKVERAARNGERLHLEPAQVMLLVGSPLFKELALMVAEELAMQWQSQTKASQPSAAGSEPSSGRSGSNGGRTADSGASTGTTETIVESAERQRALKLLGSRESPRRKR